MLILSQDKTRLVEITGVTIEAGEARKGGYEISVYGNNIEVAECTILGNYSSKARAQEILYSIMLRNNGKESIYEMPVN